MKNILIATDLTENSANAFMRAIQLAGLSGATLHVLHVTHLPYISGAEDEIKSSHGKLEQQIHDFIKSYSSMGHIEYVVHLVDRGRPRERIYEYAKKICADLIVIGASRNSEESPSFFLSRAELIIWETGHPVLIVSKNVDASYKNILVSTAFAAPAERELRPMCYFGPDINITLLEQYSEAPLTKGISGFFEKMKQWRHNKKLNSFMRNARDILQKCGVSADRVAYRNTAEISSQLLINEIEQHNIDLISLRLRHTGSLNPEIDEMLRNTLKAAPCDILVKRHA